MQINRAFPVETRHSLHKTRRVVLQEVSAAGFLTSAALHGQHRGV